jgi:hypothetical protein
LTICETCGYEIREGKKHIPESDGRCQIVMADSEVIVGWATRKTRDLYKKK